MPPANARAMGGDGVRLVRRGWLSVGLVLAVAGLLSLASGAGAATTLRYSVIRLHDPLGVGVTPTGLNDHGYVVGWDESAEEVSWVWSPSGRAKRLASLSGNGDFAMAISNSGVIVGGAYPPPVGDTDTAEAVIWPTASSRPVRLPTLGGTGSVALAVNDNGVVAGSSYTRRSQLSRAVIWRDGAIYVLDSRGFIETFASDINAQGTVIGWGCHVSYCSPLVWRAGGTRRVLSGHVYLTPSVDDRGTVVGTTTGPDYTTLPTVWSRGTQTTLPTPDGVSFGSVEPSDINNAGDIVGTLWYPHGGDAAGWNNNGPNGALWHHGSIYPLTSLIQGAPGLHIDSAAVINERGQVAVEARDATWSGAALLTPH
jgi:uncharacterized membrane protein